MTRPRYAGFCVAGIGWRRPALAADDDASSQAQTLRRIAADEARLIADLGGNLVRLFYSPTHILETPTQDDLALALAARVEGVASPLGIRQRTLAERVEMLDRCDFVLDSMLAALAGEEVAGFAVNPERETETLAGYADAGGKIEALMSLVAAPPRWIIEAPSAATLASLGRQYSFATLWERYKRVQLESALLLVRKLIAEPISRGERPLVCAWEIVNEPDYTWIPDDVKIEGGAADLPLWKYVTELHLAQIPHSVVPGAVAEPTASGTVLPQDGEWNSLREERPVGVTAFDWGPKFDWYVRCYADFLGTMSRGIADAARQAGHPVEIVSGGVTHNNLDYLLRVQRADPAAFEAVTKIGVHPYHWVKHDVWDPHFRREDPLDGWKDASPREYADAYFKRFDFIEVLAKARARGRRARGVERELASLIDGRGIWMTEFGIGRKVLGKFNAPIAEYTRFIRPRQQVGGAAGFASAIWEDLWEAFFDQVDTDYLSELGVECIALYALSEIGAIGVDVHDDDRSNLGLVRQDGSSVMDEVTRGRLRSFMRSMTTGEPAPAPPPPRYGLELHRRPWRGVPAPPEAFEVTTMLSEAERRLLYWLAAEWYTGQGAVVDAGSFVGGSTVPLGLGLRNSARAVTGARIDVYDLFVAAEYMKDMYFADDDSVEVGGSLRPIFDRNTAAIADLLTVHEGDFTEIGWDGRPIELFFLDISKGWELNDALVRDFFPYLIPDGSVLIQQDHVYTLCPWIALTMEYLADRFEPVAFEDYDSVVYVCRQAVDPDTLPASFRDFPIDRKIELMDQAIARFHGYPRAVLEGGKAFLLADDGDQEAGVAHFERIWAEWEGDATAAAMLRPLSDWLATSQPSP